MEAIISIVAVLGLFIAAISRTIEETRAAQRRERLAQRTNENPRKRSSR